MQESRAFRWGRGRSPYLLRPASSSARVPPRVGVPQWSGRDASDAISARSSTPSAGGSRVRVAPARGGAQPAQGSSFGPTLSNHGASHRARGAAPVHPGRDRGDRRAGCCGRPAQSSPPRSSARALGGSRPAGGPGATQESAPGKPLPSAVGGWAPPGSHSVLEPTTTTPGWVCYHGSKPS